MENLREELVAARAGAPDALGRLLEAYRPYLAALAEQQLPADLRAKAGVSDLLQQTFAEACEAFPRFAGATAAELLAWLQRILTRNAADLANRYRNTDKRRLDRELSLNRTPLQGALAAGLAVDTPSPSAEVQRREEAEILERALGRLPEDYRQVVLLHHRDNLSFEETALRLGRSEAATRKLWARAIERWRREVEELYDSH